MFHCITAILFLYVYCRLLAPLPLGRTTKRCLFVAALLLSQQHVFLRFYFGGLASPELPAVVLLLLSWAFISFVLLALFTLAADLLSLLLCIARKSGMRISRPFSPARRAGILLLCAMALAAYGEHNALRVPEARTEEIVMDGLSPALDGLTLVHVTDLHASALLRQARTRAIVDAVSALDADIILLTGDLVDGTTADRAADVAPLKDLRARSGVFACAGNHEYYVNYADWMTAFDELGLTMLANSHRVVSVRNTPVVIAGVTDSASSRYGLPGPDINAALAGAPKDALSILLAHRPYSAPEHARAGVDMQLSGHTHGGQILGLHLIVKQVNNGFIAGWYTVDNGKKHSEGMRLYVSNGAGLWSGFPVRLGVPAEITRIVLRAAKP
ncbi:MAG: metallophosphoesterase [Desulfovibrio sp.]|jgi:predicted MPP superfamily phosphohydrolase|nr:metallophosphoesterase [Desulfovibrio sp.]